MNALSTIDQAAASAGISYDEASILQTAHTALLVAAAAGKIDLNALAKAELGSRGMDLDGRWVGFGRASAA